MRRPRCAIRSLNGHNRSLGSALCSVREPFIRVSLMADAQCGMNVVSPEDVARVTAVEVQHGQLERSVRQLCLASRKAQRERAAGIVSVVDPRLQGLLVGKVQIDRLWRPRASPTGPPAASQGSAQMCGLGCLSPKLTAASPAWIRGRTKDFNSSSINQCRRMASTAGVAFH